MAQLVPEPISHLSELQLDILTRLDSILYDPVRGPAFANALLALFCADDTFQKGNQVDSPSTYSALYPDGLRRHFFPKAGFNANGVLDLGTYDRSAEADKRLTNISLDDLQWQLQFICTHTAAREPTLLCGVTGVRLERLFTHMDLHKLNDAQKRSYTEMFLPALWPEIITDHATLLKRRKATSQKGLAMPDVLYFQHIRPIREFLEATVRRVLFPPPGSGPVPASIQAPGPLRTPPTVFGSGFASQFTFGSQPALQPAPSTTFAPYPLDAPPVAGPSVFAPQPSPRPRLAVTGLGAEAAPLLDPFRLYNLEDEQLLKDAIAVCEGDEVQEAIEEKVREKQSGKASKGKGKSRTIASTPYTRPTSRVDETAGSAVIGPSRVRSSSVASNASTSSAATVNSSTSGYITSSSFTSNLSLPSSSTSSSAPSDGVNIFDFEPPATYGDPVGFDLDRVVDEWGYPHDPYDTTLWQPTSQ